ncbi:MAG: hypothetical protein Q9214_002145 [Letrouitia sp. 1 TL-2023]
MDDVPPSYESATRRDHWVIIARYIRSSDDLCAASRVCARWHQIFSPLLWGNPASHFGTENDRVYGSNGFLFGNIFSVALTRFKRSLKWARLGVRQLTHTLHLPPAPAEKYDNPHPEWLREVLHKLPNLQSLIVSHLPFFDHASLLLLRTRSTSQRPPADDHEQSYALKLLVAARCLNTTQRSLADALVSLPNLVFLDLSQTSGARDPAVLENVRYMANLQILKLRGIQLRDDDMETLAKSMGTKVRSLDVRNNLLTDRSARTLLHYCFQASDEHNGLIYARPRGLVGAVEEDWPAGIVRPDPAVLDEFRDVSFDDRYLNRLTTSVVSRLPSEDQPDSGITHLFVADNHLTVEGLSGLIKSAKLRVLDVGTINTARAISRPRSSSQSASYFPHQNFKFPGAEKLTHLLGEYASKNLTFLRIDYNVVSRQAQCPEAYHSPRFEKFDEGPRFQELDANAPRYELPTHEEGDCLELRGDPTHFILSPAVGDRPGPDSEATSPVIRRGSVYVPEVAAGNAAPGADEANPVLTTCGLNRTAQNVNNTNGSCSSCGGEILLEPSAVEARAAVITRQKKELLERQMQQPHGLVPGMLPNLRTLTLTNVPCYSNDMRVVESLLGFIRNCAAEHELAVLQVQIESQYVSKSRLNRSGFSQHPLGPIFALRCLVLEISPLPAVSNSTLSPNSPQTPKSAHRTKSATEDPDSEAFWAAQENDFSFFDDNEECSLPSTDPESHLPLSTLSEKETIPSDSPTVTAQPTPQQQQQPTYPAHPTATIDVIQELTKFRRERKAAYEDALRRGERTIDGYWPGQVKVVRASRDQVATVDYYYGNVFDQGYIYR